MYKYIRIIVLVALILLLVVWFSLRWPVYIKVMNVYEWNKIENIIEDSTEGVCLIYFEPSWMAGPAYDHGRFDHCGIISAKSIKKGQWIGDEAVWYISVEDRLETREVFARMNYRASLQRTFGPARVIKYTAVKTKGISNTDRGKEVL